MVNNNQLFWTYNENEDEDKSSQGKAPNMLIRCINEFSDYDPNEKKEEWSHPINKPFLFFNLNLVEDLKNLLEFIQDYS